MISKNIYIKEKNTLNIRVTSYGVIVIKVCIFVITLFTFANIALALNWQKKEGAEGGCPETEIGERKSEILSLHNEKIINIQDNKIVIIGNHNSGEYFLRNKKSFKIGEKFIDFKVNADNRKKEVYLKVWPYLITTKIDYEKSTHNYHNC
jgi:hypothetical protein